MPGGVIVEELVTQLLAKYKKLKGITDDESDGVFSFAIETAIEEVMNYCNLELEDIPKTLHNTIVMMAMDIVNETLLSLGNNEDGSLGDTKSLSEGDFSITKETSLEVIQGIVSLSKESFTKSYKRTLNGFRKLRR